MLITFSGLDGAGKTTLIRSLKSTLENRQCKVATMTMYDNVGLYASIRFLRNQIRAPKQTNQVSTDQDRLGVEKAKPKGISKFFLTIFRSRPTRRVVLFFDLLVLQAYRFYWETLRGHVVILDRYFYDSLADVVDGKNWLYARFVLKILPIPDLPIFVDVTPQQAFERKGEYPVDYMERRRAVYKNIFSRVRKSVILKNENLNTTLQDLEKVSAERVLC